MYQLNNVTPRAYQNSIAEQAVKKNTLVVLPTGLGKTLVATSIAVQILNTREQQKSSKNQVIFLAPTKPLIQQHLESFKKSTTITEEKLLALTGQIAPEKRADLFKEATIIFSTPQGLENDIISKRISLQNVALIIFDEAHRAQGDYSYVWIAKAYQLIAGHHILALTASPGSDKESIQAMCDNLQIEHIEQRDAHSPDVAPYVHTTKTKWVDVELSTVYKQIITYIKEIIQTKILAIQNNGFLIEKDKSKVHKFDMLTLQKQLQANLIQKNFAPEILQAISLCAQCMKLYHALELIESQGISPFVQYLDDLYKQAEQKTSKANKVLSTDPTLRLAYHLAVDNKNVEHPKLITLIETISQLIKIKPTAKIIVFNQYRDSISHIVQRLKEIDGIVPEIFVGQAKKRGKGLTQQEQVQRLEEFAGGKYNVLVMSSVGEEGLDIPQVDAVIFYEPIPSAIRSIQRRGRTGRHFDGVVQILVAKGTKDEVYKWSAHHKEKRAKSIIHQITPSLQRQQEKEEQVFGNMTKTQTSLESFEEKSSSEQNNREQKSDYFILVDSREKTRGILHYLQKTNVSITLKNLDVADYIISGEVGVEFKEGKDFVDSLLDGRLFSQAKKLASSFSRPLIIVQSEQSIFGVRNVHPNAIQGALISLLLDYNIPVLFSENTAQTAHLLFQLVQKYQSGAQRSFSSLSPAAKKDAITPQDIVEQLPGVGPQSAKEMLKQCGSLSNLFGAKIETLQDVKGVGTQRAKNLHEFFNQKDN